ncbi:MAG: diheme cytochrome c [Gammaproteobacteria bacterium]|nr:diheme cytochrome c [Gammaproteobacteria bacterium]MBU1655906.1 diheme cytochrome c [Gammaproteobacteria bacterium]MBU1961778.1 diheme cytochrome c [Gammaproteobacteria bacterium]
MLCLTLSLLAGGVPALADERESYLQNKWVEKPLPGVAPVDDARYKEACGSCHFPYQPGLLPALSWERLMAELSSHFGDHAELPPDEANAVRNYLLNNAAGRNNYAVSAKMTAIAGREPPLRISELPYFVKEHAKVDLQRVKDNPEIRSLSHCNACHTRADEGSYSEQEIRIPQAQAGAGQP